LGGEVRRLEVLLCYDFQNGIIDEEENIIFAIKTKLFSIGVIYSMKTIDVEIMDTNVKKIIQS
jgi:hypothetical protein